MNSKAILLLFGTTVLMIAVAADDVQKSGVIYIDHDKVSAHFARGGPILATNNFKVQAGRRTGPGEVEIHERDTDIFYILEGSATFVTGGTPVDKKEIGPGEYHAKELTGGVPHHLVKGDSIVIPYGIPHQFTEITGTFVYHVVKVTK